MPQRMMTAPLVIRANGATSLMRVPFSDQFKNEQWLQDLLFRHPTLLPVDEIEPVFEGLLPIARELPTASGPLDLLYINAKGLLTLVETKLWRNPEARRQVVAQILDYAQDISRWTYDDLVTAVAKAGASNGIPLVDLARSVDEDFDEKRFIDNVNRNLHLGRFLLLIVGDGIQEGVEHMAEYLQRAPQLGFTLGLVEIAMFRLNDREDLPLLVQPRLLARTREVVRAIVEVRNAVPSVEVAVSLPAEEPQRSPQRRNITEEEFFESLRGSTTIDAVAFARAAIDEAARHQINVEWKAGGPLFKYEDPESGEFFTMGGFSRDGMFHNAGWIDHRFRTLGLPSHASNRYLDEVAAIVPGARRMTVPTASGRKWNQQDVFLGKRAAIPLSEFLRGREAWFAAMDRLINEVRKLMKDK